MEGGRGHIRCPRASTCSRIPEESIPRLWRREGGRDRRVGGRRVGGREGGRVGGIGGREEEGREGGREGSEGGRERSEGGRKGGRDRREGEREGGIRGKKEVVQR